MDRKKVEPPMTEFGGDKIHLTGLAFFGFHGVMRQESEIGQRFIIDLTCGLDLQRAGRSDSIRDTVSYADIYSTVAAAFAERRFHLIEALAQNVVDRLFSHFPAFDWVRLTVRKPSAAIPMVAGEAAIEIVRRREAG
jgi:dihydroneopterin aldolase